MASFRLDRLEVAWLEIAARGPPIRGERGWSQRDLAAHAALSLGLVQNVENATRSATVRSVVLPATAPELRPASLLDRPQAREQRRGGSTPRRSPTSLSERRQTSRDAQRAGGGAVRAGRRAPRDPDEQTRTAREVLWDAMGLSRSARGATRSSTSIGSGRFFGLGLFVADR